MKYLLCALFLISLNCQFAKKAKFKIGETIKVSAGLEIIPISENVLIHRTFLDIPNYGPFPCNGLIYKNKKKAYVFDTPTTNEISKELILWLTQNYNITIEGVIINHFHVDCLGGLQAFHDYLIPSYAHNQTIKSAVINNISIPMTGFDDELILKLGNEQIVNTFFGEGHTRDNIVSWLPKEKVLFGGCMIKSLKAGKGNLKDANIKEWSKTVKKIKDKYKDIKFVIPGHGDYGDSELLDYTIEKFY